MQMCSISVLLIITASLSSGSNTVEALALALELAQHAFILETGRVVLDGSAEELRDDPDVQEFYLGMGGEGRKSFAAVKRYQRRKRWLS